MTDSKFDFDLFVIGAGSGGVRSARLAAQLGKRVGVAEESLPGGTCVVRGCVPKKFLVYGAEYGASFKKTAGYGWSADNVSLDWPVLREAIQSEVNRLSGIYANILDKNGAELFRERAVFIDAHTVKLVTSGKLITAETILIAVGGRPWSPEIKGIEHAIVSDDAFTLDQLPERALIIGGGYIACEFAGIFAGLGVKTVQAYRGDRLLNGFDDKVDEFSKTSADNVYAVGDVTNRVNLTPVAIREGVAFIETCFKDNPTAYDHSQIASAVFTRPPVGTVGLTEAQARETYGKNIKVYTTDFRPMKNALSGDPQRVFMKLITQGKKETVIGIHMMGDHSGELIQVLGICVKAGLTKSDFDATCAVHPTIAEEIVTL